MLLAGNATRIKFYMMKWGKWGWMREWVNVKVWLCASGKSLFRLWKVGKEMILVNGNHTYKLCITCKSNTSSILAETVLIDDERQNVSTMTITLFVSVQSFSYSILLKLIAILIALQMTISFANFRSSFLTLPLLAKKQTLFQIISLQMLR